MGLGSGFGTPVGIGSLPVSGSLTWAGRTKVSSEADGVLSITKNDGTVSTAVGFRVGTASDGAAMMYASNGSIVFKAADLTSGAGITFNGGSSYGDFNLQANKLLWGTSSSYPALKRNTTDVDVRLGDDSAYSGLNALYLRAQGDANVIAAYSTSGNASLAWEQSKLAVEVTSGGAIQWAASSTVCTGTKDTGLARTSAGVVKHTDGSTGLGAIHLGGTAVAAGTGGFSIGGVTRTTIGSNGAATALTANPLGYIDIYIGNTTAQIPYYNRGA